VSSEPPSSAWTAERLPRGRHRLSKEAILASQRARLLGAMVELVARQGYADTTVPQVVAEARVARNAFYELFNDKTDCFIALCDELANEILAMLAAFAERPDWLSALREGLHAYLLWWQERGAFARAYFVELPGAGTRAVQQRDRQLTRFVVLFEGIAARARSERDDLPPLAPHAVELAVLGTTELIAREVRAGRVAKLVVLEPALLHHLTLTLAGEPAAAEL
jgi:AcrR family transcriptional regulator